MTTDQLINRLAQVIRRDEKHPDYERVNALAKLYRQLITGKDMDGLMRQFTPRESDEMFKQRLRLTQHITKTVSQNVMDIIYKVPRSNSVQRSILYKDNNQERLRELNGKLEMFWGDMSLDDYMNTRWIELNGLDPNTFTITEWSSFDNKKERATPYPFEASSEAAIMFEYVNNDLAYLIVEQETETWVWDKKERKDIKKETETYTIYGDNQTVKFTEIEDERESNRIKQLARDAYMRGEYIYDKYFIEGLDTKDDVYEITVYPPHNLGYVPAVRVGFKRDLYTNGRTCVSLLDKAVPIFMKMVKANSELDLTMALHTFPQKIQYASPCHGEGCNRGFIADGSICTRCNGTGYEIVSSAQDAITLAMPQSKDEMLDLANVVHYNYPPVELVQFQDKYVDKLTVYVKEAIFNTELFSKKEVSETATGKNISLQNVYDSLYPVATAYSKVWYFLVTTVADIIELSEGLVAFYHFSKDFKLKSLTDLYLDLKTVGDARASEFVKGAIEGDIASIIYSEDQRGLQKYNVKQSFFPFSGKSPEDIRLIISGTDVSKFTKVFYANFGQIFDEIELEQSKAGVDFYVLAKDKQRELINAKVEALMATIEAEQPKEPTLDTGQQV